MQDIFFLSWSECFSEERLSSYRLHALDSNFDIMLRYLWNMRLCESFYPALHNLEIVLRNKIYAAVFNKYGNAYWFDDQSMMRGHELSEVARTRSYIVSRHGPGFVPSEGRIISELGFGFWNNLFVRHYDQSLFHPCLSKIFSDAPKSFVRRQPIYDRLKDIRELRNRIFHHEPIFNRSNLLSVHNSVLETIRWLDANTYWLTQSISIFPSVYRDGADAFYGQLRKLIYGPT